MGYRGLPPGKKSSEWDFAEFICCIFVFAVLLAIMIPPIAKAVRGAEKPEIEQVEIFPEQTQLWR